MPTMLLEKFFAELASLFYAKDQETMTALELRIANLLVDAGYGWWADDGTRCRFKP